jgi:hypothetical protein
MKNRKNLAMLLFVAFLLVTAGCNKMSDFERNFQGEWHNVATERLAFTVRGDSLFPAGLPSGYPYELDNDTLVVRFSTSVSRSPIISFVGDELHLVNETVAGDTVFLKKAQ